MFRPTLTVRPHEQVLAYRDGRLTHVLGPGRHPVRTRTETVRVDLRERIDTLAPQEVLTADGVGVRVNVALVWQVADPVAFTEVSRAPFDVVYLAAQIALREALAGLEVDAVLSEGRRVVAEAVTGAAAAAGEPVGIAVREAVLKDVLLPLELRAAYADLVATRQRGKARLEAARAETAALRSLANGAKLLEEHPALARQRLVESLPPGASVEVTVG